MATSSDDAHRAQRLLKGLHDAKRRVDQVAREDAQYPDLYDQLANQSEPQNYFFEPYATQWCPQIVKKGNLIALPSVIASALEETKALSLSGLLPSIDCAWTSVDTRLFLWHYKQRGKFALLECDQAIVAVGLCDAPASGVFTDKVQHVLVVATTVEVVLVAVLADDDAATKTKSVKLQRTKLSVATDNCVVRQIVTTPRGRIFFGGSDGIVYELVYGPDTAAGYHASTSSLLLPTSLFGSKPCRKVALTASYASYLPTFLAGLATAPAKVRALVCDPERSIVYALHDDSVVTVLDCGATGDDAATVVCSLNLLEAGATYARENRRTRVSCPDERLFQVASVQIVALAIVARDESALVNVVAIASNGMRLYLTAYNRRAVSSSQAIPLSKRPSRFEIVFIRLPPPAVALADAPPYHSKEGMQPGYAPGTSPSAVHVAFYRHGVFLAVDGRKDAFDRVVAIAHDPISTSIPTQLTSRKPTIRESVSLDTSCVGKVVEIQELAVDYGRANGSMRQIATSTRSSKRTLDEMVSNSSSSSSDAVALVGELARQVAEPPRHFLCLTSAGIQVYKKIRPLDQLHRVLWNARSSTTSTSSSSSGSNLQTALAPFIRSFGEIQVCCMLVALACGVQSDPLTTEATTAASTLVARRHTRGIKSDDYIFTTAMQGIFECGQATSAVANPRSATSENDALQAPLAPTSTRIVLTTEFGMSFQHDGLVLFVSRLLRPLWCVNTLGKRVVVRSSSKAKAKPTTTTTYKTVYATETLDEVREILFQLRQLMETAGPYAVAISSGSVREHNLALDALVSGDSSVDASATRTAELAGRYHKLRTDEQLEREARFHAEQRSLYYIYQLVLRSIEAISLLRLAIDARVTLDEPLARLGFSDIVASNDGVAAAKTLIKALLRTSRPETNAFVVKQLREQCPTFFSVADVAQYQGLRSLATAKLSAPSARLPHLRASLTQFLSACYLWDSADCIDVLGQICDDYALLQFYEGVVKLSLACAKHFDDAAANDRSGVTHTWKRQCFGCILLALQRLLAGGSSASNSSNSAGNQSSPQSIDDMVALDDDMRTKCVDDLLHFALASDDREFHVLLYTWLLESSEQTQHLLVTIRSPFIEAFLEENDQDLLIQSYMDQHKYLVAAKVWWTRAHEEHATLDANPDVAKRQYFVSKALACLKSVDDVGDATDAAREVRDVLDVLQLQGRVLAALEQSTRELEASALSTASSSGTLDEQLAERRDDVRVLTYRLVDASTLYNQFAAKYDMWSECLYIIHACQSEEPDVIAGLWRKIVWSTVPPSASNAEFNAWRADACDQAGLTPQHAAAASGSAFESGHWIGTLQYKVMRLGRSLYATSDDAHSGNGRHPTAPAVFPIGFIATQLERVSAWYLRLTQRPVFMAGGSAASAASIDATTFHWVIKVFLDVGVPHRVLVSYYEQLYRDPSTTIARRSDVAWTLHVLYALVALVRLWKKHAIAPRAGTEHDAATFAASCPHLVDLCDDFLTDLQALPLELTHLDMIDDHAEAATLLEQLRRLKSDLLNFRSLM